MRVIAGSARRLPLKTVPGQTTRPTTDRIKETLFNIIQDEVPSCRFLDLFAGSGGIGIEALSRGAKEAVFVEKEPRAFSCIKENLAFTRLGDRGRVMGFDVMRALTVLSQEGQPFDIIFMDPPYHELLEKEVLTFLAASPLMGEDTLVIVEAALDTDFSYLESIPLEVRRRKEYKTNVHMFIGGTKGE